MGDPGPSSAPGGANRPEVSIVLGTLNERPNLPELTERLRRAALPSWEAIVVDDGSNDGSREFLEGLAAADPRFRPLFHDGRQTTVRAQSQGIREARGERVVVMDADLQHPPELLPALVRPLARGAALSIASRYVTGGSPGPRTALRGLLSRSAEGIARVVLPDARRVRDPVSGFFAFRRELFPPVDPSLRGYKLLLLMLVRARGRPVAEVPFRFEPRTAGASKVVGGIGFVRVFLTEVLQAKRLELALRAEPPRPLAPRPTEG